MSYFGGRRGGPTVGEREYCSLLSCPLRKPNTVWTHHAEDPVAWLVGEAPGQEEEASGYPFVGKSGRELNMYLRRFVGYSRDRFTITNTIRCRPPNNRDPSREELDWCSIHLVQELEDYTPRIVGAVGRISAQWFMHRPVTMEKAHGIPVEVDGRIVVPIYHPSYGLHSPRRMKEIIDDFVVLGEVIRGERDPVECCEHDLDYGVVGRLGVELLGRRRL